MSSSFKDLDKARIADTLMVFADLFADPFADRVYDSFIAYLKTVADEIDKCEGFEQGQLRARDAFVPDATLKPLLGSINDVFRGYGLVFVNYNMNIATHGTVQGWCRVQQQYDHDRGGERKVAGIPTPRNPFAEFPPHLISEALRDVDEDPGPWISEPAIQFYDHFADLSGQARAAESDKQAQELLRRSLLPEGQKPGFLENVGDAFEMHGVRMQKHDIDIATNREFLGYCR